MDKLALSPEADGYGFDYAAQDIRAEGNGGAACFNAGIWNAAVPMPVTWRTDAAGYEYLCTAWQTHIDEGGAPFLMDILIERDSVREYLVRMLPDSFGLSSVSQDTYVVTAQLEVRPVRLDPDLDTWPDDLVMT